MYFQHIPAKLKSTGLPTLQMGVNVKMLMSEGFSSGRWLTRNTQNPAQHFALIKTMLAVALAVAASVMEKETEYSELGHAKPWVGIPLKGQMRGFSGLYSLPWTRPYFLDSPILIYYSFCSRSDRILQLFPQICFSPSPLCTEWARQ